MTLEDRVAELYESIADKAVAARQVVALVRASLQAEALLERMVKEEAEAVRLRDAADAEAKRRRDLAAARQRRFREASVAESRTVSVTARDVTSHNAAEPLPTVTSRDSVSPTPPSDPGSLLPFSLCSDPDPERAIPPPLLVFPCDGPVKEFPVTEEMRREHSEAFPSLNVLAEYRKALAWIKAAPERRKTARGMAKFLVGWLGREQNSASYRNGHARASPAVAVRNFKEEATAAAFERARAARKQLGGEP